MKKDTPPLSTKAFVFIRFRNRNTPQWKKTPLPPLPKPSFLYVFEKEDTPPPSTEAPFFFTPSKLEYIRMKEGTPPPSTEAPIFSRLPKVEYIGMKEDTPPPFTEAPVFSRLPNWKTLIFSETNTCRKKCVSRWGLELLFETFCEILHISWDKRKKPWFRWFFYGFIMKIV